MCRLMVVDIRSMSKGHDVRVQFEVDLVYLRSRSPFSVKLDTSAIDADTQYPFPPRIRSSTE